MTTEMLITTLFKILTVETKLELAIVIIINQEDGMVMPKESTVKKNVNKKGETKKKINIIGDSMVKHITDWDLSAKLAI